MTKKKPTNEESLDQNEVESVDAESVDDQLDGDTNGDSQSQILEADENGKVVEKAETDQDLRGQLLRAHAELDNFRKRTRRENEERAKFAILPILRDLLEVVDNLNLALQAAEKSEDSAGLASGVEMVRSQLMDVLKKHQCKQIPAIGAAFDPNLHEALQMQPSEDVQVNYVLQEVRAGFQLHDRVIRPAQVFVSTGPSGVAEEDAESGNTQE